MGARGGEQRQPGMRPRPASRAPTYGAHPLTVVTEQRPGLGRARNRGWRAAAGELVAFTDDECYPSEDYLDRVAACFEEPSLGFVEGGSCCSTRRIFRSRSRSSTGGWTSSPTPSSRRLIPERLVYHHHGRKTREDALRLRRVYDTARRRLLREVHHGSAHARPILGTWMHLVATQHPRRTGGAPGALAYLRAAVARSSPNA